MNKEMNNTNDLNINQEAEKKKKDNKKKLLLLLLALLLIGGVSIASLAKRGDKVQEVATITDEQVPTTDKIPTTDKAKKPAKNTTGNKKTGTDTEVTGQVRNESGVLGARVVEMDTTELLAEADAIRALVGELPTVEPTVPTDPVTPSSPTSPSNPTPEDVEDVIDDITDDIVVIDKKKEKIDDLKKKLAAIKADMDGLKSKERKEAEEYAALLEGQIDEESQEMFTTIQRVNEQLENAKNDAITAAKASGEGMEVLQDMLDDENSAVSKFFSKLGKTNGTPTDGKTIVSTGKNWALGDTKDAGDGVNHELIENASEENKDTLEANLPTSVKDTDPDANKPGMAYQVEQEVENKKVTGHAIYWCPNYQTEILGTDGKTYVQVYRLSADGKTLEIGTMVKGAGDASLHIGGQIIDGSFVSQGTVETDDPTTFLTGLTAYDASAIAGNAKVEENKNILLDVLSYEAQKFITEYAALVGKTFNEAADELGFTAADLPQNSIDPAVTVDNTAAPADQAVPTEVTENVTITDTALTDTALTDTTLTSIDTPQIPAADQTDVTSEQPTDQTSSETVSQPAPEQAAPEAPAEQAAPETPAEQTPAQPAE